MSNEPSLDWVDRGDIEDIVRMFRRASALRDDRLLRVFMPRAYGLITLSSVPPARHNAVSFAKVIAGALITLLDDVADRPDQDGPGLLREAAFVPAEPWRINWTACPSWRKGWLEVVVDLGAALRHATWGLPHAQRLWPWLMYEFGRCHQATAFASLVGTTPEAVSAAALADTQHQNVTVCLAGLVDLMASDTITWGEFGVMRAVFEEGQRATRISNVMTTYERELNEADVTNELGARVAEGETREAAEADLERERQQRVKRIRSARVTTFDVAAYADGIERVHQLHREMQPII